jgi:protease-4
MTRRTWIVLLLSVAGVVLLFFITIGIVAAVSLAGLVGGDYDEEAILGEGAEKIAIVRVDGQIHGGESDPGLFGGRGAGARDVIGQIRQAMEDDTVQGVILRVDSPGGAVVASDEIARAVRRLRERKPVVASMGDLAASGGYYIASQAQRIIANPGTITGSIGVIAILPNLEGTASKLGIQPVVITAGELKDVGSPFREMRPQERDLYQRLLDEAHTQFIEAVARGREQEPTEIRELADGRPYSGLQAERNGLVDDLGDLEDAYDAVLELAELSEFFRATVSSEEVARGKPAPDVYLEAAERLGADAARCAAIEDSHSGIRSAKAAGMRVVAIPNAAFPPEEEALAEADVVLRSLPELRPEAIENDASK